MRDLARKFLSHDCGPFAQFVKYGAVGVMATCVHLAVFYLLASTCLKCLTEDDKAVRLLSLPSAAFTGAEPWYEARWFLAAVATALYGRIYDRIGYRKTLVPALLVLMLGYAVLYLFRNTALVFLGSLLMMCGYLGGMAVFGARVRDCTPAGMAGRFQGLRIIGQVLIPGVVGPEIAKLVLKGAETVANDDGTFSFIPNENIFLWAGIVLLPIAAVIVCELLRLKRQ